MNNITFGQYIPANSWVHRLDPRYKLMSLILFIVAIFVIPIQTQKLYFLYALGGITVLIFVLLISSKIPLFKAIQSLRPVMFLLVFTFIVQVFTFAGDGTEKLLHTFNFNLSWTSIAMIVLITFIYFYTKKYIKFKIIYFLIYVFLLFLVQYYFKWALIRNYNLEIFDKSLIRSGYILGRVINVILLSSILTFTTTTTELNHAIESLLKPLKLIKVPVDTFAMMMSLTFRYIPTLVSETDKIIKAQSSRGVDFKESPFYKKVKQIISLLIPVFVISFKRAEDLADAMEVRGYVVGARRTRIDKYKTSFKDILVLIFSIILMISLITIRILAYKGIM